MSIVRKDWSKEEIYKWFANDVVGAQAMVHYSTNGGITWLPFQFQDKGNIDSARIVVLAQRGYLVREIKQEKVNVTSEQAQVLNPTSTFMNSVAVAQTRPAPGSKFSQDTVTIYRTDGGGYWFSSLPLSEFNKAQPSAVVVTLITRTTYYDAVTPNKNVISTVQLHKGQQTAALRQLGYVFRIMPANEDTHISHWWPVLQVANQNTFKPEDWISIRCARHYDESLDETFRNVGNVLSVVGGKWIWGWNKRFKFGDTWIAPATSQAAIVNRIAAAGMALEPTVVASQPQHNPVILADNTKAEMTPEYIMGVRDNFEELLKTGDKSAIIEHLFKVIEYRNKCVDELKELNKAIEKARDIVNG